MAELANLITVMVKSGDILWLVVLAMLALGSKLSKLLDFIDTRRRAKINRLVEAIKCSSLDIELKNFFESELQREYFLYVTNIPAEKEFREKLYEIHGRAEGNLPFYHFKRAANLLDYKDGQVFIKITIFDTVDLFLNFVGAIVLWFSGIAMFILPVFSGPGSIPELLKFYGIGVLLFSMGLPMGAQLNRLISAKKIQRHLASLNSKQMLKS